MTKNPVAQLLYFNLIEDLSDAITHYGAKRVLEDLQALSLTSYEELVTMVMRADGIKKQTAVLLKDPYFANKD